MNMQTLCRNTDLVPLSLPEHGGLRVSLGLTRESSSASLHHNLVAGPHNKLGCL